MLVEDLIEQLKRENPNARVALEVDGERKFMEFSGVYNDNDGKNVIIYTMNNPR